MEDSYSFNIANEFNCRGITVVYKYSDQDEVKITKDHTKEVNISMGKAALMWLEESGDCSIPNVIRIRLDYRTGLDDPEDYEYRIKRKCTESKPTWEIKFKGSLKARNSLGKKFHRPSDTVTIGDIPPDEPGKSGD